MAAEKMGELLQWLIEYRAFVLLGIALTYSVLFVPFFASERNITQMTTQFSIDGIISIGLTILMIAWGIDLGVGATLALGGVDLCSDPGSGRSLGSSAGHSGRSRRGDCQWLRCNQDESQFFHRHAFDHGRGKGTDIHHN